MFRTKMFHSLPTMRNIEEHWQETMFRTRMFPRKQFVNLQYIIFFRPLLSFLNRCKIFTKYTQTLQT